MAGRGSVTQVTDSREHVRQSARSGFEQPQAGPQVHARDGMHQYRTRDRRKPQEVVFFTSDPRFRGITTAASLNCGTRRPA